jgi:CubicO group peptidase (beta-lactamase class C family)
MRSNRVRLAASFVLVAVLALSGGAAAQELPRAVPEEVGLSSARLDRLTSALEGYVNSGQLPGAVAMVVRRGRVAYLEAFGQRDREAGAQQQTDDIFRIASQSKAVISVAVMMLQEEGKLLLTDRLSRFLPEFAETTVAVANEDGGYDVVEADRQVTLRDLLTHTSGSGYGGGAAHEQWAEAGIQGWYFADRDEPIRETVRRMAPLPFVVQPGEQYVYGYSTDILGAVVEVASGVPLDEFLRTRIFEPLDMRDTHFYLPADKGSRLSAVYSASDEGLALAPDPGAMVGQGAYVGGPRMSFSGGAGLLSTARDYARFLQMMLDGGELGGVRILSRKSVELMTVNHVGDLFGGPAAGTGFGLGFMVVEDLGARGVLGSVGEYGWGGAYHSTYWVDPEEELVVVYFAQLLPANGLDDHARLRALIYQAIMDDDTSN